MGCSSRIRTPDPDPVFSPIADPGSGSSTLVACTVISYSLVCRAWKMAWLPPICYLLIAWLHGSSGERDLPGLGSSRGSRRPPPPPPSRGHSGHYFTHHHPSCHIQKLYLNNIRFFCLAFMYQLPSFCFQLWIVLYFYLQLWVILYLAPACSKPTTPACIFIMKRLIFRSMENRRNPCRIVKQHWHCKCMK